MSYILQDWAANSGNPKARLVLAFFRLAQIIRRGPRLLQILGLPILVLYRVLVEWVLGIELPWNTKVGPGLRLFHGMGLVVNDKTVIGRNVVLRHTTTIGVRATLELAIDVTPIVCDGIDTGENGVILGPAIKGLDGRIGAGSAVANHVPA